MARTVEMLLGGLVTQPDPAFLSPGQLSNIRNMVYRNGANGLCRAYGRQFFGSATSVPQAVNGLRDVKFQSGDQYLIAMSGGAYSYATVGDTGSFTVITACPSGTALEVVQYGDSFFLMNGATASASASGSMMVAYQSATASGQAPITRPAGLLPVLAAPNVTTAAGTFSQTATGYYEYWTTEVAKFTQDGASASIEGAFSSQNGVTTVYVSSTGVVPTVQLPAIRNQNATHWRIYRSPKKLNATDKEFPSGYLIGEVSTAVSAQSDTSTTVSASSFPASFVASRQFAGFASASSMASADGTYASASTQSAAPPNYVAPTVYQGVYGFNLSSYAGTVVGIVVEVKAYVSSGSAPVSLTASVGVRDATWGGFVNGVGNWSKSGLITGTTTGNATVLTLGSSTDRWWPTDGSGGILSDTDIQGTNFMVALSVSKPGVSIGVDYVKVTIYGAASVTTTDVYPAVVYTYGDITSQVSKNFPPPSSSTGDVFQDQLVVNDMSDRSLVRYSFPGLPESFPPSYYLDFQTRENDKVQHIRVVNGRLVVGLDTSTWRINYLPSETDASFDRGDAIGVISRSYGIVNPMCACTFTIDGATYFGQNEQLAFVSNKGICTTDGYNFMVRTKNQDWRQFISTTAGVTSYPIALLNNPEERCLRFYYRNDSLGNETYMCLHLSYDSGDIDQHGNFKVSGPVHCRNYDGTGGGYASVESAWALPRSSGNTGIYIGYGGSSAAAGGGSVYFETGTAIPSNDSTCQWTSRRIYKTGMSGEWMLGEVYGYVGKYSGAPLLTYSFESTKTNDTSPASRGSKTVTLAGGPMHRVVPRVQGEGIRITMQAASAGTLEQQLIVIDSTDYGIEDSGR